MSENQNALNTDSPKLFSDLIIALAYILDVQEDPCPYHAWRVGVISAAMAERMMPERATEVFFAALLHDIGVMGNFSHMIRFPNINAQKMKPEIVTHPQRGSRIISRIPGLENAAGFIADHHEWWNGCGYPSQKMEEMIPLGAQIIRTADTVDLAKKFQPESTFDQALETIDLLTGIEVSPEAADAFRAVISDEEFYRDLTDESKLHRLAQETSERLAPLAIRSYPDAVEVLVSVFAEVVDSKHCFSKGHSEQVAAYAVDLGHAMGLPHDEITKLRFAGLLHDTGKVAVRRSVIDKVGPLIKAEYHMIKYHPVLSMEILRDVANLPELALIARYHHERWDGTGYPDGLEGEEIPLLSRILAVADSLDAITSQRSYKEARSIQTALNILREASGTQFDPRIVDAAFSIWNAAAA